LAKYEADITKLLSLREKADTRMVALEDKVSCACACALLISDSII
jgi:hypothetical protein